MVIFGPKNIAMEQRNRFSQQIIPEFSPVSLTFTIFPYVFFYVSYVRRRQLKIDAVFISGGYLFG